MGGCLACKSAFLQEELHYEFTPASHQAWLLIANSTMCHMSQLNPKRPLSIALEYSEAYIA